MWIYFKKKKEREWMNLEKNIWKKIWPFFFLFKTVNDHYTDSITSMDHKNDKQRITYLNDYDKIGGERTNGRKDGGKEGWRKVGYLLLY